MVRVRLSVTIDLRGLNRFAAIISRDLRGTSSGPIRDAMKQWGARYRSFVQRRFVRYSRGGGNWKPLAPSTLRARRRGNKKKGIPGEASHAILRDTGVLFAALDPVFKRKPGALQKDIRFGIRVGYGGPARHPTGEGASVADIARFHQRGHGNRPPKREIIVKPDAKTQEKMAEDMERAILKLGQKEVTD